MNTPFKFAHAADADWTRAAQACMNQLGAIPSAATLGFLYVSDAFAGELDAILRGGEAMGQLTLTRFFAIHIMVLVPALLFLVAVHVLMNEFVHVMRTGITQDPRYAPRMRPGLLALPSISLAVPGQPEYEEKEGSVEVLWPNGRPAAHARRDPGLVHRPGEMKRALSRGPVDDRLLSV